MTTIDIAMLPVWEIAADDCLLAMWWTGPMIGEAVQLANRWGFTLKNATGFSWVKTTSTGGKWAFGMGHYTRGNVENVLFAVRGRPKRICAGVPQLIIARRQEHSRKPDAVADALVRLMGDVPRVELFARQQRPGWDVFGNEVDGSISL